ncbi:MAG: pyridoxine 5'-phosphate synthase [Planctomycetes bacterium]|nr:pyridoxine 5'-phosphate synthase [Planctomycetota bacterium]
MPQLYVNLDHVATVRQARGTPYPSVVEAALVAEATGRIHGITLHLREDRRHVHDDDMREVGRRIELPFNFEMSVAEEIVLVCLEVGPAQATLVPEKREELTTEGGLDLDRGGDRVREVTARLKDAGTLVSLFIDPDADAIRRSLDLGATHIELHTGRYADATNDAERLRELDALREGARLAHEIGLVVNAGHGLTHENVGPVAAIPNMEDLNIGHAIVARAILLGLPSALAEMRTAMGC